MALTKDHTAANGLEAPAAYHKIVHAEVRSIGVETTMEVAVATYKNKAMADAGAQAVTLRRYNLGAFDKTDSGATAHARAYAALKLVDDFLDASDA